MAAVVNVPAYSRSKIYLRFDLISIRIPGLADIERSQNMHYSDVEGRVGEIKTWARPAGRTTSIEYPGNERVARETIIPSSDAKCKHSRIKGFLSARHLKSFRQKSFRVPVQFLVATYCPVGLER